MYSIPPYYGDKKFETGRLPDSIYPMKPYYFGVTGDNEPLPSASLPVPSEIDLNDRDSRMALEDLLSRQLLLFCRLNDIERDLMQANDIEVSDPKPICLKPIVEKHEEIVVHFNLEQPPLILLTLVKVLVGKSPSQILINYHLHSSVLNDPRLSLKQQNLDDKLRRINFNFSSIQDNTDRSNRQLIITFIAKKLQQDCFGCFKSNQPPINGELNIVQEFCSLISPSQNDPKQTKFWKLLTSDLTSTKFCIENLGQYFVGLNGNKFLLGNQEPGLLDVIVWSLANFSDMEYAALKSLIDAKWSQVIELLVV